MIFYKSVKLVQSVRIDQNDPNGGSSRLLSGDGTVLRRPDLASNTLVVIRGGSECHLPWSLVESAIVDSTAVDAKAETRKR